MKNAKYHLRNTEYVSLLQLRNNRPLRSADQRFRMRSVALVEPGGSRRVLIDYGFSVRGGRTQVAVFKKIHYDVFVVEVHGRGYIRLPGVIPHDHARIFEKLFDPGRGNARG